MKVAVVLAVCALCLGGVVQGANPNYSYHIKIDDPSHVNFQEKAETRKGEDAQGFYSVLEPNGALRTVSYTADERGFNPIVSYTYGHPQSSVTVHSATGTASVQQRGVYAPAYVTDNRVQITDKSNIYAAPPPALNLQTFALPGPSSPVVVPAPLRQATPVVKASAAIAANYAPAYVPPPTAYLPPPQPQVLAVAQQPQQQVYVSQQQAVAVPQPQVLVQQPQVLQFQQPQQYVVKQQPQVLLKQQPQVFVKQPQVLIKQQPQVLVKQQPQILVKQQPQILVKQQPQILVKQQPQVVTIQKNHEVVGLLPPPAIAVTKAKVVKTSPAIAVVEDSYSTPPQNTFRDPNAQSYPDARPKEQPKPSAEYGPPAYDPPPPIYAAPPTKVVKATKVVQPVVQQIALPPPQPIVQKIVSAPAPAVAVQAVAPIQKVVAQPQVFLNNGLYAGAIGFHTHTAGPDAYVHNYGTQGFQVTSSRKYNKAIFTVPKQIVRAPPPQYGPPAVAVQKVVQAPALEYGLPQTAIRVEQPKPIYGPPPTKLVQQQVSAVAVQAPPPPPPPQVVQTVASAIPATPVFSAPPPPPQVLQTYAPAPAPVAVTSQTALAVPAAAPLGKKRNPLTFAYSYDQGGAKVTHSYSGSGW